MLNSAAETAAGISQKHRIHTSAVNGYARIKSLKDTDYLRTSRIHVKNFMIEKIKNFGGYEVEKRHGERGM